MRAPFSDHADSSPSWTSLVAAILREHSAELAARRRNPHARIPGVAQMRELELDRVPAPATAPALRSNVAP